MPRLDNHAEKYRLDQSPLFGLKSKKRLGALLYWPDTARALDEFVNRTDNYKVFEIGKRGRKPRWVQEPKERLKALHRRLATLLLRIEPPGYLQSGLRGRSFVSNGQLHVNDMPGIKLDVVSFYPSTTWNHVYRFFENDLHCSPDVSGLLATASCHASNGTPHLPTGSCLSQILAFYCHKSMFDEIDAVAARRAGVMTVYVDDITISVPDASPGDILAVGRIISREGLRWHKERFFPRGTPKRVTGTIAKPTRLEADNKQHWKYRNKLAMMDDPSLCEDGRRKAARSAIGLLQSIAQVDRRYVARASGISQRLRQIAG